MMTLHDLYELFRLALSGWSRHRAPRLAAALAYYTAFSMAPLLVIAIAIATLVFDKEMAAEQIIRQIEALTGHEGAMFIKSLIHASMRGDSNVIAASIGMGLLLFGATGAFVELRNALNTVWGVETAPDSGVVSLIFSHLLSLAMVLAVGFLLLVSLVISATLAAVDESLQTRFPSAIFLLWIIHITTSLLVITVVFALVFKFLPDKQVVWRHALVGAAVTAVLFVGGKFLIGLYLGHSTIGSTYGAAGSFVVLLIWTYYSAQIVLYGAEFTQVYSQRHR